MLLTRLVQYAASQPTDCIPPPFHAESRVSWMLDLDTAGQPITGELVPVRDPADPQGRRGVPMVVPSLGRTSAVVPLLACDKIEYALGWPDPTKAEDPKVHERARRYHQAFIDLTVAWSVAYPDDPAAQALRAFLTSGAVQEIPRPDRFTAADVVMFRVDGQLAHEAPTARTYWPTVARKRKSADETGRCLVCAREMPLLKRAPRPVRPGLIPIVGYDPFSKAERKRGNGASLVSVNQPAHGFNLDTELLHTPLCETCAEAYTAALEHLLNHPTQRRTIGDTAFIWWIAPGTNSRDTDRPQAPIQLLFKPDPIAIAAMLDAPRKGTAIVAGTARTDMFCAATLSNNSSRIVIRDWLDVPLSAAEAHIASWFADMKTTDPWTGQHHFPSLFRLLLALGRWQPSKQSGKGGSYAPLGSKSARRPVWAQRELLHAAVNGRPLSAAMLAHLLLRIRTDSRFDLTRQALLRLCLTRSHPNDAQELPMALDSTNNSPAYLAGRVFATLEALQYAATRVGGGTLNTTLADRYFSRAVTSPASVLIPALRNSRAHLKKLRTHQREKSATFFTRSLDELTGRLQPFPTVLTIQDQGVWLNGYADQRNYDISRSRARGLPTQDLIPDTDTDADTGESDGTDPTDPQE